LSDEATRVEFKETELNLFAHDLNVSFESIKIYSLKERN
jgi:hypothetical protein